MSDTDFTRARLFAAGTLKDPSMASVVEFADTNNLRAAYLTALEALEYEVAGREHDLTAKILGPRMPDRHVCDNGHYD